MNDSSHAFPQLSQTVILLKLLASLANLLILSQFRGTLQKAISSFRVLAVK